MPSLRRMTALAPNGFDASTALARSAYSARVQTSNQQKQLDINEKIRSSLLPWRGQFSPQLVEFLIGRHTAEGQAVLDPFCGSGTVMIEAARLCRTAAGFDVNPAAVTLARVSGLCRLTMSQRFVVADDLTRLCAEIVRNSPAAEDSVVAARAAEVLSTFGPVGESEVALRAMLLVAFADAAVSSVARLRKAARAVQDVVLSLPAAQQELRAEIGDARRIPIPAASFDYIVTSPPYINVFNYHQNYRPIIEALGESPLHASRSEIGANRKFRQNRFLTVVQYCMDIALALCEMARVLKSNGRMTIVIGRESQIRSVPFWNGELLAALAIEGMGYDLAEWNERKFINRFGATIYEDMLTLTPRPFDSSLAVEIGRAIGKQALSNAVGRCQPDRRAEIEEAAEASAGIAVSPMRMSLVEAC